ncbi:MAG: DUF554 domain-containing protein [Acetanaerobacterium sp.]
MTGTLINAGAIIAGSMVGLLVKKGIPQRISESIQVALGLAVIIVGISGVLTAMVTVGDDGRIATDGIMLLILSLVLGTLLGESIKLEERLTQAGLRLEKKIGADGFAKGLIGASMLYCVGAMSIVGALNDGLLGDRSVLLIKSTLDGISAVVLTATLGVGVLFSFIPVLVYQGTISLGAGALTTFFTDDVVNSMCLVGFALVICIGINLMKIGKIRTVGMLPAMLVPILYNLLIMLKSLWL